MGAFGAITIAVPQSEFSASADSTVGSNATSGLSSFTTSFSGNTINLAVGTPTAANVSWSGYSKDGQVYSLNLGSGKFGVQKGGNFASLNTYVAVLNIAVPQWIQDLATSSTTVSVKLTGDYYCWRHRQALDDAEFYFGMKQSSTLLAKPIDLSNSSVRDNLDEDSDASFLPGYSLIKNQKIGTGTTEKSETGTYTASFTLSSTAKFIGVGIAAHADAWPGYATPESYIQNLKLTFTVDATVKVKCNDNGSFDYSWYPNATASSSGTATTGTITAGNSFSQTTKNPFAYVVVTPKQSTTGYRFQNVKISGTNRELGYDSTKDDAPKTVSISLFADSNYSGLTRNGKAYDYNYRQSTTASEVNFVARQYKIIYRPNGGTGSDRTVTYEYDKSYTVPSPADYSFSKTNSVPSGWTYGGKTYTPGNSFSNLYTNLNNNTTILYFDVVWVEVSATKEDSTIDISISSYSDKYSDVTFTVTAKRDGHTLSQIYATYTSGDLENQKIALEQSQAPNSSGVSKWVLYGISGNCKITAEWRVNTYEIVYSYSTGSISATTPNSFIYGQGLEIYDLPYITASGTNVFRGWSTDGTDSKILYGTNRVLTTNTAKVTLTAMYDTSGTPKNRYTSTTTGTAVSSWTSPTTSTGSPSYSASNVSMNNENSQLTGKSVKTSGLGWRLYKQSAQTYYAYWYVALEGAAYKAWRSGQTVKIKAIITSTSGAYCGTAATSTCYTQVFAGVTQGYSNNTTMSNVATGAKSDAKSNKDDWHVNGTYIGNSSSTYSVETLETAELSLSNTTTSVPAFTIKYKADLHCSTATLSTYENFAYIQSVKFVISYSGKTTYSVVYNSNFPTGSGATATSYSSLANSSRQLSLPHCPWSVTGYEFVGWGSASNTPATSAAKPGSTPTVTSNKSYYAIWTKKKYPVNTYDVWTDGTNYATTIRKQTYVEHGDTVTLNNANGGGGDYAGFTVDLSKRFTLKRSSLSTFYTNTYQYAVTQSYKTNNSYSVTGCTSAQWGGYVWVLDEPTTTLTTPEAVDYGYSIDLDSTITVEHNANAKEISWVWKNSSGGNIAFYKDNEFFLVEESDIKYNALVTVKVVRGGKTLSKSASSEQDAQATIRPLRLKIELSGETEYQYNGEVQEFPLRTVLDEDYYENLGYSAETIEYFKSVLETERNASNGYHPWYYDEEMEAANATKNFEKWRYGLDINIVAMGYSSYIADGSGTEFYDGSIVNGLKQFKDAGHYWASQLRAVKANENGGISSLNNRNYVWSQNSDTNDPQLFHASDAGAEGTVSADILPADGFNLYAFYTQKTFGKIADPTPTPLGLYPENGQFDIETLKEFFNGQDGNALFDELWLIAIDGLLDVDYDLYKTLIASKLKRDTSAALHQKAGLYDVYLDTSLESENTPIRTEFLRLLNNYGVKLESATSTLARSGYGTVKMYWVNQDGSIKDGSYDFTYEISEYNGERNNFEIIPKDISIVNNSGSDNYIYDGKPQGPDQLVVSGYVTEEEKQHFAADYGDGYEKLFTVYFYGIPLPASLDWKEMSAEEQAAYIEANKNRKAIVGYDGKNYINGVGDRYAFSLKEINAGQYAVVIIGAAYKFSDNDYRENDSFNMPAPFYVAWEIQKKDIIVNRDASHSSSMVFGDVNYGAATYVFTGIVAGDKVKIQSLEFLYENDSADGFIRYATLSTSTYLSGGTTYYVYGTFAGDYNVKMNGVMTDDMSESTKLYGVADNNYGRYDTNYTLNYQGDPFTISHRTLATSDVEYTTDGGATFSSTLPDMTYVYGVKKGIRLTVSNFYDPDFLTNDVAAKSANNPLVGASDLVDFARMKISRTYANSECVVTTDAAAGTASFLFTAINAATYTVHLGKITYSYNDVDYGNYDKADKNVNYTINKKTITVLWKLDGKAVDEDVPSVVYNGKEHSVTAELIGAASGVLKTDDNLVYYGDFIDASNLYSVYQNKNPLSLEIETSGSDRHTNVNVDDDIDKPYETYLKSFTSGNYLIAESGQGANCLQWAITRREFTISVTNPSNTFIYDGKPHQAVLNLEAVTAADEDDVEVVLDNFGAIVGSGSNFTYTGLVFNAANKSLSATNSGIYSFSYNATAEIKIDRNWLLTGSADYSGDNFLLAIVPRVLKLGFNTTSANYNSNNLVSRFRASYIDAAVTLPENDLTLTYNLDEIIHAGTYDVTVTGATSASGNFVLAEADPSERWYATIADGERYDYYADQEVIDTYTATVTVNKYTITLDPTKLNEALADHVYDGLSHGYTLTTLYEEFIKSLLLCEADKEGYTLKGASEAGTNVGTYTVTIEDFNPFNGYVDYRFAQTGGYTDTWSITARELVFGYVEYHSGGSEFVYDGYNHGYTLTVGNIVDGEYVRLTFNGNNVNVASPLVVGSVNSTGFYGSAAANYSITNFALTDATVEGVTYLSRNYSLPEGGANKSWVIEKKTITVEWHNTELTYRASAYTPTNGGVYATVTNIVGSDTFNLNYGGQTTATNADDYVISIEDLTGGTYGNYQIVGSLSTQWTIKKKELTVFSWAGVGAGFTSSPALQVTYDGANHSIKATPTAGAANADDGKIYDSDLNNFTFTYSTTGGYVASALIAGDYKTKIIGCNSVNYSIPSTADVEKEWKISARELTVTYKYNYGATITYCAAARGVVLEISGFVASDFDSNLDFTVTDAATAVEVDNGGTANGSVYTRTLRSVNVGSYAVSVAISDTAVRANCYTLNGDLTAAFTIVPLVATLEWKLCDSAHANKTAEYDGNPHKLIATVTNLASSGDEVTVTIDGGEHTDQGSYTGVATAITTSDGKNNYALPESEADRSCSFTISPRAINVLWEETAESYTYNGKYQSDKLTLSRLVATDDVTFKVEFYRESSGSTTLISTASIDGSGKTSYVLTADDFRKTINYGTYVAIFDGKVYNSNGTVNTNYSFKSVADNEKTRFAIARATLKLSGVWSYSNNGNSATYTDSTILIYNAKSYTLTTAIDPDSLFVRDDTSVKDTVTLNYTGNVNVNANVGTSKYTATAATLSGTYATNYLLPTKGVSVSYAIAPKEVALVWENYENLVYNGQDYTVTAKILSGATSDTDGKSYDGDSVSVSEYTNNVSRNANVGDNAYTATAVGLDNDNYVIASNATLDWTVAPRPVVLNWSFATVEYDGTEKTVTATVSNCVSGDTVILTYGSNPSDNVGNKFTDKGTYTASVTQLNNTNYTLTGGTNVTHEWNITPILLEFGWSSGSGLVYNGNAQGITLTVSNIADADYQSSDKLSFTTALTPQNAQTVAENRTANPIKITFKATDADTYTITVTALGGTSNGNYELPDNVSATFKIAKKVIVLDWSADDFVYSQSEHAVTAAITNAEADDEINLTYLTEDEDGNITDGNAAIHAGLYFTTVTAVDNKNYTITGANDLTYEWTIDPKPITDVTFKLDAKDEFTVTYDRVAHVLTAAANSNDENEGTIDDGKLYYGDSVTFTYAGTVVANYGLSAITRNSATNAGQYRVTLTASGNGDYTVSNLYCDFTVSRRVLTLTKEDVTTTDFTYNGQQQGQGVKMTVNNLLADDNTSTAFSLNAEMSPTGTAESAVRSGANYSRRFLATDAGKYTLTFSLSGTRYQNYVLAEDSDCEFTITRKKITTQISADVTADNIIYRAEAIDEDDLSVTFNNLITGERLTLGGDFSVAFEKDGVDLDTPPMNVGAYTAKIALKSDGNVSVNYELSGATEFLFEIKPYEITPNMLSWTLNDNSVNLNALTFKDGENKTVAIGSVSDDIFNKIEGKGFSYVYFGLCNCGLSARTADDLDEEHLAHQWLTENGTFRTDGPEHAGSYFVVITLDGGDADNFILTGFDGYTGNYFMTDEDETYLAYYRSANKLDDTPLPQLGENVAALRFGIARLLQGVIVDAKSNLPYKGTAYTVGTGLPEVTAAADTSHIRVEIGSGTYTYEEYSSSTFNAIKNAGEYTIKIYDSSATGETTTVSGCDLFNSDAEMEVNVTLTVEKAKITVTDTSDPYWTKVYDRKTSYTDFTYSQNVTFASDADDDGNIIATSDGVLTGTTATVTAAYNNYNAGTRTLTFTLGGTDRANYYLAFSENGTLLDESKYTVNGYAYAIPTAQITKRIITVAGSADKVFDGTDEVKFNIVSADIIKEDENTVEVTGTYTTEDGEPTAHAGTHAIILTANNDNYEIDSNIKATGTISPKPLTVAWTGNETTTTYDGDSHGVSVTVSGMLDDFLETITVTGNFASTTAAQTDGGYTLSSSNNYSFTAVNAGDYSVILTLGANSDYSLSSAVDSAEWHISPLTLTITWVTDGLANEDDGGYIYNWGENFTVQYSNVARSITPQIGNLVTGDDVKLTVANNSRTLVGKENAEITEIVGASANNYALPETCSQTFEIIKATIKSITLDDLTTVYNGEAQGVEVSSYVTQHGIKVNVEYDGGAYKTTSTVKGLNAFIDVTDEDGEKITATIASGSSSYEVLELEATVKITPSPINSITLTSKTVTYDKKSYSISVNTNVTNYDDAVSVSYTINGESGNSATDAGTYTIVATIAGDAENNPADKNYIARTRTATLTINKADIDENRITVEADSGTLVYDAQPHGVTITVTDNQTQYGDAVTITLYGGENNSGQAKNVGTYEINAVVSAGDNYNDYTTSTSVLKIEQKTVTLSMTSADEFTYDGEKHSAVFTFASGAQTDTDGKVYDGDVVTVRLKYLGTSGVADGDTELKNSGTYTVTATLSNGNYKPTNATATITVKKATISGYFFEGNTVTYNNKLRYLSINTEQEPLSDPIIRSVNLLAEDDGTVEYTFTTVKDGNYDTTFTGVKNAGTYYLKASITADGDAADNYETWEKFAVLIINPSLVTSFTMDEVTVVYDGLSHAVTVTVPQTQLVDGVYHTAYGDVVSVTYTITDNKPDDTGAVNETVGNSAINVNTINGVVAAYTVTARLSFENDTVASNYRTDNLDIAANLTISPASLKNVTLTCEDAVYDGNAHDAVLSIPSSSGYPYYELNDEKTELTVYLAQGHKGDVFTVNKFIEDAADGVQAIDAGSYDFVVQIRLKDPANKDNYAAVSDLRKTVNVSRAVAADEDGTAYSQDVNLFFNDDEITYCGNTHYLVLAFDNALAKLTHDVSDVLTKITLHPSANTAQSDETSIVYSCDGASFEGARNAGVYEITATVSHKNYRTFTLTATITINKATVDYYFVGTERTYDMATHFAALNTENNYLDDGSVTSIALQGSDAASVSYAYKLNDVAMGKFNGALYVGTYAITATITILGDVGENYEVWGTDNAKTVNLKITPYEADIIWTGRDETYVFNGNPINSVSASFIGADGSTNVNLTVSYEGISGKADGDSVMKNAGVYKLTASHAREDNYIFTDKVIYITVEKAVIERYLVSATEPYAAKTYYLTLNRDNSASASVTESLVDTITVYGENITVNYTYSKNGTGAKDAYVNNGVLTTLDYGARNAGTYTVTAMIDLGDGESNFEDWAQAKSATLTISPLNLTVTSENEFIKTYDGTDAVTDCVIGGIIYNSQYIRFSAKYSDKNAGDDKPITITADTDDGYEYLIANYTVPSVPSGSILQRKLVLIKNGDLDQTSLEFWRKPQYDGLTATVHSPLELTADNNFIESDAKTLTLNSNYNSKNVLEATQVRFTLTGASASNYTIDNLNFADQLDFEAGKYLIMPKVTDVSWSTQTTDYNGRTQTVFAYLDVLGQDVANEQLVLTVSLRYTKDGNGKVLDAPVENAVYKNAGTYIATASIPETDDENVQNMLANYGITENTATREFTISKVTVAVNWSGLSSGSFTYNGTDQGVNVKATATLRGNDVTEYGDAEYLVPVFTVGGVATEFKNAGEYTLVARFAESVEAALGNNYNLTNTNRALTMKKATIDNITFNGAHDWEYTDGTVRYYFVSSDESESYIVVEGKTASTPAPVVYYRFDPSTAISVYYSGGDSAFTQANGNNGVKNYGTNGIRTVTATVAETENYESWTAQITVTVRQGTLSNIVMESYTVTYNGAAHYLYAHNGNVQVENGKFSQIVAPDGSTVDVAYEISVGTYYNEDFDEAHTLNDNYAVNAGTYLLSARITSRNNNYKALELPGDGNEIVLEIEQCESTVVWAYNKQPEPNYTYNATDQAASVVATILSASSAQDLPSASQNKITLSVAITLLDDIDIPDALKSRFVIAGKYSMTASFDSNDENYQRRKNNYKLTNRTVNVQMKKYIVEITWYNDPDYHDGVQSLYDYDNPCIYNAKEHGITAEGIGINGTEMTIITDGTFNAVNAGTYNASVSKIAAGKEHVSVDGENYEFDYELNYALANKDLKWRIASRPITITAADNNYLSKIYDGSKSFVVDGYEKTFSEPTSEGVVNIGVTYTTADSASTSRFGYFINNVMAVDQNSVFLPIASINADKENILATQATVAFGILILDGKSIDPDKTYNYVVSSVSDGIIQQNDDIITPRDVIMLFRDLSHIYNGESYSHEFTYDEGINGGLQFNQKYDYELFRFYDTESARIQLVDGNYLIGSVDIGGNINAGTYGYVVSDLKAIDADGAENYSISINNLDTAAYTIKPRKIAVAYSNLLQSQQAAFADVEIVVDLANSDFTDIHVAEGKTALSALNDLVITNDGLSVTVDNSWKTSSYNEYTRIIGATVLVGETSSESLTVYLNSGNYEVEKPVLQITYLQIEDVEDYKFYINNLDDLLHLDGDCYGLGETRDEYGIGEGIIPTFTQTANIDGLVNGSYSVMTSIRNFRGLYLGKNHVIANIDVAPISDYTDADGGYAGFFARITEGSVKDLTLTDIHVYSTSRIHSAGGFAGLIDASATVTNVDFNGTLYAYADYDLANDSDDVAVGGFVGTALNTTVTDVSVAIKMTVVNESTDTLYVGGFAGLIDCGAYENIFVFADVTVKYQTAPAVDKFFGGIAGNAIGDELTVSNFRYLASSLYVNDGNNAILYDRAFGNVVTFESDGTTYDGFIAANDGLTELIRTYMIRDYLLPTGANGTAAHPVEITNFRQVSLIIAYPYMNFKVTEHVRSPLNITTYNRGFYGVITYDDGSIRSDHPASTSDVPLTDAIKDTQNVTIGKKEDD